jgi:hypothetical protein
MWFHENEPIKDDDIYKIMAGEEGEVVLYLPEVFLEDAGVYTVKAVNEAGEVSCTAVLTVLQGELFYNITEHLFDLMTDDKNKLFFKIMKITTKVIFILIK